MRAAVFHAPGDLRLEQDRAVPGPRGNEVLIRVESVGICGSDLAEYRQGPIMTRPAADGTITPVVMGHEFGGQIVAVGPEVQRLAVGTRVACGAGVSCGHCPPCRAGRTNLCRSYYTLGYHRDGGLAEYCVAPEPILVDTSPYSLSPDTLGLAQPMAVAVHAVRRSRLAPGDLAVVVGAGGIGAFITYAAAQTGAEVWAADIDADRLRLASALGATRVLDAGVVSVRQALDEQALRADVLFEVTGAAAGLEAVLAAADRGATVVPVGVQKGLPAVALATWTLDEYDVVGTVAHVCRDDLPTALEYLDRRHDGWADVAPEVHTLEDIVHSALEPSPPATPKPVKVLVDPHGTSRRAARHAVRNRSGDGRAAPT